MTSENAMLEQWKWDTFRAFSCQHTTAWCHFSIKHHNFYLKHTIAIKKNPKWDHLGWFWNNVLITNTKSRMYIFLFGKHCTTAQIIHFISTAKSSSLIENVCAHGVGLCPSHHIAYTIYVFHVFISLTCSWLSSQHDQSMLCNQHCFEAFFFLRCSKYECCSFLFAYFYTWFKIKMTHFCSLCSNTATMALWQANTTICKSKMKRN